MQPILSRYLCHFFTAVLLCLIWHPEALADEKALEEARRAFQRGDYSAALQAYDSASDTEKVAAGAGKAQVFVMTGQYDRAEQICRSLLAISDQDERVITCLAESLYSTGRSDEALRVLEPAATRKMPSLPSLVLYGQLLQFRGRTAEARSHFEKAVSQYESGLVYSGEDVALAAVAARALNRFHEANALFRESVGIDPDNLETHIQWGNLFLEKYNKAEAQSSYQTVLKQNRQHVPALVGMARTVDVRAAEKLLDAALQVNPRAVSALAVRAGLLIDDDRLAEAQNVLQKALEINPESLEALTLMGTIAYLNDDKAEFERIEKQVQVLNPRNGAFYARIAEISGRAYRFDKAVEMAQKAVALDPEHWNGHTILGMNLLRLGREETGRSHLDTGFEGDPFNVWAMNMLKVLDVLDGYETRTTDHFVVRMHPSDADVLWPYLEPLLAEAWRTLTAKYGFEPPEPILIEIFKEQQDFSVRTSGLPEIGHLLGVCFGSVITLASPQAYQPPGATNWQEVVWHEFAHVITLHMTDNKIPRWLSEGVSVFEETSGRPEWGRRQDLELVTAVAEDRLIRLEDLDEAFSRARTLADINFAYYQSSLVVDFIVAQFGFEALKALIYQYAASADIQTRFQAVFQLSPDQFEQQFLDWIDQRVKTINIDMAGNDASDTDPFAPKRAGGSPGSATGSNTERIEALRRHIESHPRDFNARFQLGLMYYRSKDYQPALHHLAAARDLLPGYSASPNPRQILAAIYEQIGDEEAMLRELEALVKIQQDAFEACVKLGQAAAAGDDFKQAAYYLERAIAVNPYDLDVHRTLAQVSMRQSDYKRAVREFGVLLALDDTDPALANTDLAEALLRGGNKTGAKQYALAALEIAPMYDRAQDILLDSLVP